MMGCQLRGRRSNEAGFEAQGFEGDENIRQASSNDAVLYLFDSVRTFIWVLFDA